MPDDLADRWLCYSRVRFTKDHIGGEGVPVGTVGHIVEVWPDAYEVEVMDDHGATLFLGAVPDNELELLPLREHLRQMSEADNHGLDIAPLT